MFIVSRKDAFSLYIEYLDSTALNLVFNSFKERSHCLVGPTLYKVRLHHSRTRASVSSVNDASLLLRLRGDVRSIAMSMSVCLSVSSHNSKTTQANFTKCLRMLPYGLVHAQSSYGGVYNMLFIHRVSGKKNTHSYYWL